VGDAGRTLRVGVRDLLEFYAPALLRIGVLVRQCTWNGGPQGTVKGDTAHEILRDCLFIQVHLLQDWEAQSGHMRTMAVALLMWQPWMSRLPGCAFVEESGEALLSRYAGACRRNKHLSGFEGAYRLFMTLPQTAGTAEATRGSVRADLVQLIRNRVRALLARPDGRPHPSMRTATAGDWVAQPPPGFDFPGIPPSRLEARNWRMLLQSALAVLSVGQGPSDNVSGVLDTHAGDVDRGVLSERRHCHEQLRQLWEARQNRVRIGNRIRRPPGAGRAGGKGRGRGRDGLPSPLASQQQPGERQVVAPPSYSQPSSYETGSSADDISEGYHSPGDTDGLGSLGDLEESDASASEGEPDDGEEVV
jgi:hypothetical protein